MNKFSLAIIAGFLAILATPASAQHHSHGHGHGHGHSYGHRVHVQHYSHGHHSYHKPLYHQSSYHKPSYQVSHYAPKQVYVQPTTTYEKRPAYVYQKVAGYCVDAVKSYGYNAHRKTVECKAGEYQKPEPKIAQVEPVPAPVQEEEVPQK